MPCQFWFGEPTANAITGSISDGRSYRDAINSFGRRIVPVKPVQKLLISSEGQRRRDQIEDHPIEGIGLPGTANRDIHPGHPGRQLKQLGYIHSIAHENHSGRMPVDGAREVGVDSTWCVLDRTTHLHISDTDSKYDIGGSSLHHLAHHLGRRD